MRRLIILPAVAALALAACALFSGEPEKQWYKPNADYTAADFERDRYLTAAEAVSYGLVDEVLPGPVDLPTGPTSDDIDLSLDGNGDAK